MGFTPEIVLQCFRTRDGEHSEDKMRVVRACTVFYDLAFRLPRQNANRKETAKMLGQRDFWVIGGDSQDRLPS